MNHAPDFDLHALIDRMTRLAAADDWAADLNPSQSAAIAYLARANRFSRAPSHVAAYLSATRGTVSQTLKALQRKGLIAEQRSDKDRRSIAYTLTPQGRKVAAKSGAVDQAIAALPEKKAVAAAEGIRALLTQMLTARGARSFGLCKSCTHFRQGGSGAQCALLKVNLTPDDTTRICHEHAA